MQLTLLKGYPDLIGRKQVVVGFGNGPKPYSQANGDPVTIPGYERYIEMLFGGVMSTDKSTIAIAQPGGYGPRQTWSLFYYVASSNARVSDAADLSALVFQIGGITSEY